LDGRFSTFSGLWSPGPEFVIYLLPMFVGGLLGGFLGKRVALAMVPGPTVRMPLSTGPPKMVGGE
jgi:uncharacterized membrane protein YfcA